ncbi:hypothetical protein MMAD_32330 [Mycolicibacterium madagascariense]|uniref:Uncharacterized protein n=1 Tax=Mycolicibacterium madagascariense TaxID=212765 RepID=A0A7I7XIB5_9MYCO|nr:hypothetical protein MMAD_32330 [Mycolicibacterium madagascariense]
MPFIRLHDAWHTCATLVHSPGVPIAPVAAWLGDAGISFTTRTRVHTQTDALLPAVLLCGQTPPRMTAPCEEQFPDSSRFVTVSGQASSCETRQNKKDQLKAGPRCRADRI